MSFVTNVKFKKTHPDAVLPSKKREGDTGLDITAVEDTLIRGRDSAVVPTGITVADCKNFWYLVLPRSGLGFKYGIQPHLGVIDQEYRGDLTIKLYNFSGSDYWVKKGDKIAQIAFYPLVHATAEWSEEVTETDRGAKGFGSSGK